MKTKSQSSTYKTSGPLLPVDQLFLDRDPVGESGGPGTEWVGHER